MEENIIPNETETVQTTGEENVQDEIRFNIYKYPILASFVNKLTRISDLFNNTAVRILFFNEIISKENLKNKEEYEEALEVLNFIKKYNELIDFTNNEVKEEVNKYVTKALKEIKKELKKF